MAGDIAAVDPAETNEQGQELQHSAAHAMEQLPPDGDGPGPLGNLGGNVRSVLSAALPPPQSGPSQHLSPGQFSDAIGPGGAGVGEMGAAEGASGVADLAPLAAGVG
jgi:hypothetical protein